MTATNIYRHHDYHRRHDPNYSTVTLSYSLVFVVVVVVVLFCNVLFLCIEIITWEQLGSLQAVVTESKELQRCTQLLSVFALTVLHIAWQIEYLFTFPRQPGELFIIFFDLKLPRDIFCARRWAHRFDMHFLHSFIYLSFYLF